MKASNEQGVYADQALPPPVSLESERRKAMMLIHSTEKDVHDFREKFFRRPKNHFKADTVDLVHYVTQKAEIRPGSTSFADFKIQLNSIRQSVQNLYTRHLPYIDKALERAARFEELVRSVREKLRRALDNHVGRYCHSFSSEASTKEIPCVQEYENNITRWRSVVKDSFALLDDILNSVKDLESSFEHYIFNYEKVLHYMHLALEVFPRIYNPLKDWVTADEAYIRKLQDEANDLLKRKLQLAEDTRRSLLEANDINSKVSRAHHQTSKLREKLSGAVEQRQFCRRQEMLLVDNATKLEVEVVRKKEELEHCLQQYYTRQYNSEGMQKRIMSQASRQQNEVDRLEKRLSAVHLSMGKVRKQRVSLQKEVHKLQTMHDRSHRASGLASAEAKDKNQIMRNLQEENKVMGQKLAALRVIRTLKLSPVTLKKIHSEGYIPGRKVSVTDPLSEACGVIAADIGKDWVLLYSKLPFSPERDLITRSHDIQVIDITAQKKDIALREAAARSLNKWRRLSQDASVSALIRTLSVIKKQSLANKVEKHFNSVS